MNAATNALVKNAVRGIGSRRASKLRVAGIARSESGAALVGDSTQRTDSFEFKQASRVQTSLLAPLERKCLDWLVRRTPSWVLPDHLTLLGFIATLLAGATYAVAQWWPPAIVVVNLWLAMHWLGDSLDGTLARFRGKQRPRYGFYVDHMADALGALFILSGLAVSGFMSTTIALIVLVAFSLLSINVYLATYTIGVFRLSFFKFSPTELRVAIALGNIAALLRPSINLFGQKQLFLDVAAVIASIFMLAFMIVSVSRNVVTLYRAERV